MSSRYQLIDMKTGEVLTARRTSELAAARKLWARNDRHRGYSTYRNGRPYARAKREQQQLKETLLGVGGALLLVVCAGLAG